MPATSASVPVARRHECGYNDIRMESGAFRIREGGGECVAGGGGLHGGGPRLHVVDLSGWEGRPERSLAL